MFKFTINAHSKSKARLLCKQVKHFIVGQDYEIYFTVTNISNEKSTPGRCFIIINWPGTKACTTWDFHIKSLEPHIPEVSETKTYTALSTGLALISLNEIKPDHTAYKDYSRGKLYFVRKRDGKKLGTTEAFDFIFATTPEAIYTYWALLVAIIGLLLLSFDEIIATIGLIIISFEKIFSFLKCLFQLFFPLMQASIFYDFSGLIFGFTGQILLLYEVVEFRMEKNGDLDIFMMDWTFYKKRMIVHKIGLGLTSIGFILQAYGTFLLSQL